MKDLIESIRRQIYERMTSPFFGTFVIAWLGWNHQYLLILASSLPVQERFPFAHNFLYPNGWQLSWPVTLDYLMTTYWGRGMVAPLVTSVGFILIYPYPSRWLFAYWHKRQIDLKKRRDEIEGETLLTKEESRNIVLASISQRQKYEEQIASLEREIDALKNPGGGVVGAETTAEDMRQRIAALENEIARRDAALSPQNPLGRFKEETVRGIEALLKILAELPGEDLMLESEALDRLKLVSVQARHILDKALEAQVVMRQGNNNAVHLRLNERGREYVVEHKLIPTTPREVLPLPVDSSTQFHQILRLLDGKIPGMLGSEIKSAIPIPERELRELLDELKQRKFVSEETAGAEYRYRITQLGTDVVRRLPPDSK